MDDHQQRSRDVELETRQKVVANLFHRSRKQLRASSSPEVRDTADFADDDLQRTVAAKVAGITGQELAGINYVLANGRREKCLDCGDPLSEARLRAMPTARRCVWCESLLKS